MKILFICSGNLNRSPAAQTIMKKLSTRDHIISAAIHNNRRLLTTKGMREALERRDYKYTKIWSKPVRKEFIIWADIVFYMQPSHLVDLQKITKSYKYINLAHFINKTEIHDPHTNKNPEVYDNTVKDIEKAIKNFLKVRHY